MKFEDVITYLRSLEPTLEQEKELREVHDALFTWQADRPYHGLTEQELRVQDVIHKMDPSPHGNGVRKHIARERRRRAAGGGLAPKGWDSNFNTGV